MSTRVILSGPLFDGRADAAARDFVRSFSREVAEVAQTWIRVEAEGMDRSGRGGSGRAAGGVKLAGDGGNWTVTGGIRQGEFCWPWLEGTSKRNQSTGFRGYKTFRRTRLRLRKQIAPLSEQRLAEFLARMGGAEE